MDIEGPLPTSQRGNGYLLVMCDYATWYLEAVSLHSIDVEQVAEKLVVVFATDQGSIFTSQLLREVYNLLKVQAIQTSPYHPQTDSMVERFNQTLKLLLRKVATEEGKYWDRLLPYLLFAYREVPQASTGFSPFELLYDQQAWGPLDVLKETCETDKRCNEIVASYVLSVQEKLARMSELMTENLVKAQNDQKRCYDHHAQQRVCSYHIQLETAGLVAGSLSYIMWVPSPTYEINMFDNRNAAGYWPH